MSRIAGTGHSFADGKQERCHTCGGERAKNTLATECPQFKITPSMAEKIAKKELDFVNARWVGVLR